MEANTSSRELKAKLRNEYGDGYRVRFVQSMLDKPEPFSYEQKYDFHIYRVPERIRKVKEEAFEPLRVSIGPFYHGNSNLVAMEEHKLSYMLRLLRYTADPRLCLDECWAAISKLDEKVRQSYAESIRWNATELAEIMLVDACFILVLFLSTHFVLSLPDDIVLDNLSMVPVLCHDLFLIENQIPYFVLDTLCEIIMPGLTFTTRRFLKLPDLALDFLNYRFGFGHKVTQDKFTHLLDLLCKSYFPKANSESEFTLHKMKQPSFEFESTPHKMKQWVKFFKVLELHPIKQGKQVVGFKHCATRLLEAGIEFERAPKQVLTHITFSNGIIKIPRIHINKTAYSIFRNLIVYEQCGLKILQQFTSYIGVLRSLISSSPDIRLLQERGIITHELEDEEVVALLSSILQEVEIKDFSYSRLCNEVNAYHISWWNPRRTKAILNRNYFPNPWRTIQFVFVIVIQLLVVVQTFYAVLAYHK